MPAKKRDLVKNEKGLTPLQASVVDLVMTTTDSGAEIARRLEKDPASIYRIMSLPHVQEEVQQRTLELIGRSAPAAARRIKELTGAQSEYVSLQASQDLLDRAGFKPIEKSMVGIKGDLQIKIDLGD